MNNLCSLLRCAVISFQKCNQPMCIAIKKFEPYRQQSIQFSCSAKSGSSSDLIHGAEIDEFDSIETSPYSDVDFSRIVGNDVEKKKQLELLRLELYMMYQDGRKVPQTMTDDQWATLLRITKPHERIKHYRYLWLNETRNRTFKVKQIEKRKAYEEKLKSKTVRTEVPDGSIVYGLGSNTLFHRINECYMNRFRNFKLFQAMLFDHQILIDCGYESCMSLVNMGRCSEQLFYSWAANRLHSSPYHLVFCNMNPDSILLSRLRKRIPTLDDPDFPFFYTTKHYTELHPKNRLVYLTPDAPNDLINYDPEDVYIIGGHVDKGGSEPLSKMKAKKEGLRMAKLPLDKYLQWTMGIKTLTINQVMAIMNDIRYTRDWNVALKHVPSRKLSGNNKVNHAISKLATPERNAVYKMLIGDKCHPQTNQSNDNHEVSIDNRKISWKK